MERQYTAKADSGSVYIYFEFYSEHRANSKANKADAQKQYSKLHGHPVKIVETWLNRQPVV